MIELVFVACLASATNSCEERSLLYQDMPMQVCVMRAQIALAAWVGDHPDWTIREWSCHRLGTRPETV